MDWSSCYAENVPVAEAAKVATLGCAEVLFTRVLNYAFIFAGTTAVAFLIWAGLKLVLSGGDPKQIGAARQIATYAIIGLIVVLLSYSILTLVSYLTGVTCIQNFSFQSCGAIEALPTVDPGDTGFLFTKPVFSYSF